MCVVSYTAFIMEHSNPIQVSCQNPGVDGSHNIVLLSFLQLCDKVQWFYASASFQPAEKCQTLANRCSFALYYPSQHKVIQLSFSYNVSNKTDLPGNDCINCLVLLAQSSTSSFDIFSIYEIFIIRRRNHISAACRRASIVLLMVDHSQQYSSVDQTTLQQ